MSLLLQREIHKELTYATRGKDHVGDAQSVFILQVLDKLIMFCQSYLTAKFGGESVSRRPIKVRRRQPSVSYLIRADA